MKKVDILGILIDSYTMDEALSRVRDYMECPGMVDVIQELTIDTLIKAKEDETVREVIEGLDLAVFSESELIRAAKSASGEPADWMPTQEFFQRFMRLMILCGQSAYLLGNKSIEVERLSRFLQSRYRRLNIIGCLDLETFGLSYDGVANTINSSSPDIIISVLPTPQQEYFLKETKEKLNAKIWFGLGEDSADIQDESRVRRFTKRLIQKGKFQSMLSQYEDDEEA